MQRRNPFAGGSPGGAAAPIGNGGSSFRGHRAHSGQTNMAAKPMNSHGLWTLCKSPHLCWYMNQGSFALHQLVPWGGYTEGTLCLHTFTSLSKSFAALLYCCFTDYGILTRRQLNLIHLQSLLVTLFIVSFVHTSWLFSFNFTACAHGTPMVFSRINLYE